MHQTKQICCSKTCKPNSFHYFHFPAWFWVCFLCCCSKGYSILQSLFPIAYPRRLCEATIYCAPPVPSNGCLQGQKALCYWFQTKPSAGEIQIVLTITADCEFSWGVFPSSHWKSVFRTNPSCTSHFCKSRPYQEQLPNKSICRTIVLINLFLTVEMAWNKVKPKGTYTNVSDL